MRGPITLWLICCLINGALPLQALDYYWVGGSGDWSDIRHWATIPGGAVTHNKAPSAEDNVIFDANSFSGPGQTVTIDASNAFCGNMTWRDASGTPTLAGVAENALHIHGALILTQGMNFEFLGALNFLSRSAGNEVDLAGHQLPGPVLFEGEGGAWQLSAPLSTASKLMLVNGTLITGDQPVTCERFHVLIAAQGGLQLGASRIEITGNAGGNNASVLINTDRLFLEGARASFELSGSSPGFILQGADSAAFKTLHFTDAGGDAYLEGTAPLTSSFGEVTFAGNGSLSSSLRIGRLELAPGKIYTFQSTMTYEVDALTATGDCVAPIQLFASLSGVAAAFKSDTADILIEHVSLRDIHAVGSASFEAANSADLGNTQGWSIAARTDNNLYWVGGAGNWNDPAHWSFSSGGPGGACIPTGADHVFFDANSFGGPGEVVTINIENAFCRNMSWVDAAGTPVLMGAAHSNLRIYGSLELISAMDFQFAGDVRFESPRAGNRIATAGQLMKQDVIFDGFDGGWELAGELASAGFIYFQQGTLRTLDHPLLCARLLSEEPRPRRLELGSSTVTLRYLDAGFSVWELNVDNLELDAGTSLIRFASHGNLTHSGNGSATYHDITFEQIGFIDAGQNEGMGVHNLTFLHSGTIFHSWSIARLELTKGYEYRLDIDNVQDIGQLVAEGACDAYISIRSVIDDVPAPIRSDQNNTGRYLILKDMQVRSGSFTANNSLDLGNNEGWTIHGPASRTLYWVGGTGDWEDAAHWSLSSGGPGGECIPTPADDVIFDARSFDGPDQTVTGWQVIEHYCRNMTWRNLAFEPTFDIATLQLFGSLELSGNMMLEMNVLQLRAETTGQTITSNDHSFNEIVIEGSGSWRLEDPLVNVHRIDMLNGTLITNDQPVTCGRFQARLEETPKVLRLGSSHITIDGPGHQFFSWEVTEADFTLKAERSVIELNQLTSSMRNQIPLDFHNVLFSATGGLSKLASASGSTFNLVRFNKDGVITGESSFDTLFFSPGKSYELEGGKTQTIIEHFQIFGNNCSPIKLSSTQPGQLSTVFMSEGVVNGDFIQMRDQEAAGDAAFYAGLHSTDIGKSNAGWVFESAEAYVEVGFLGTDVVLCRDQTVMLDANNNSSNEKYLWQDGSAAPQYIADQPGTYWAEVSFGTNCVVLDSVVILPPEAFEAALIPDTTLCAGERVILDATFDAAGVTYRWQDGSTGPAFEASEPGAYSVELQLTGCTDADTIQVDYIFPPPVDLGTDTTLCDQATLRLEAASAEATGYFWQDSLTTDPAFTVASPGIYWVDLMVGRCASRDSMVVDYYDPINPDLGPDTTLCESEVLTLEWPKDGASYTWPDGSTGPVFEVEEAGTYWVEVRLNGCTGRDSIFIQYKPLPQIDIGGDTMLCEGNPYELRILTDGDGFSWPDGSREETLSVTAPGIFWAEATLNGCRARDTAVVEYQALLPIDLGPDTTVCRDQIYRLDPGVQGDRFRWQDGFTGSTYPVRQAGVYAVEIIDGSCVLRDTVTVQQRRCTYFTYYIPNAFSPNGDGINDQLQINFPPELLVLRFRVHIFDRWGNLLFQSDNPDMIWDGTFRSQELPQGVYVYAIELEYMDDQKQDEEVITGDVLLVR